jgi:hypothetical protein
MQLKPALHALCLAAAAASAFMPAVSAHADALSEADDYVGRSAQSVCGGLAAAADRDAVGTELAAIIDDSRRYAEQPFSRAQAEYILAGAVNSNCPTFQPLLQSNGVYDAANSYAAATRRGTQQGGTSTPPDLPGLAQAVPGQPCTNTETFVFGITHDGQTLACLPSPSPSYGLSAPVVGVRTLGTACPDNGQLAQATDGEPMMCLGTPGSWMVYRDL